MHVLLDALPGPPIAPPTAGGPTSGEAALYAALASAAVLVLGAAVNEILKLWNRYASGKKGSKTDTIKEWKSWSGHLDDEIGKLRDRSERCEEDRRRDLRAMVRLEAHVMYLETALRAAGVSFEPFDRAKWDWEHPNGGPDPGKGRDEKKPAGDG